MANGFGTEFGGSACPHCGFQPGAGAWQAGMMPTGPMPGTMPGSMPGMMPGTWGTTPWSWGGMPGMWGAMPWGGMPGMMPGMTYGQPYGPSFMPGSFAPGWTNWSPDFAMYGAGGIPDDEDIEQMVYDALDADPSIPYEADINVDVTGGVVMLSGTVPNKRVKHAAGDDAWWIPDVMDVHNQLQVMPRRERVRERTGTQETATTTRRTTGTMAGTVPTGRRSGETRGGTSGETTTGRRTAGTMKETSRPGGTMTGQRTPGRPSGTTRTR